MPIPPATIARWAALALFSGVLAYVIQAVHLPAALFLGPLIAAIVFGAGGIGLKMPRPPYVASMAIVGAMVGNLTNQRSFEIFAERWPLLISIIFATVLCSSLLGYAMTRRRILPGSTAIWGTSVGASLPMIVLAEAHGADPRIVAFMHYIRVLLAAGLSALLARFWLGTAPGAAHPIDWFPQVQWLPFAETLAVTAVSAVVGEKLRIPAGVFLGPVVAVTLLKSFGVLEVELPYWLLLIAYFSIGWGFGLNFTKEILLYTLRVLPQIVGSIILMILICVGLAAVLVYGAGIDPVTAYLATTPGSTDSTAIIAAETKGVDASFVMAMQVVRMFILLLLAPKIASIVATLAGEPVGGRPPAES